MEVVQFKKIFLKNGYSSTFIENCIRKFLNKIFVKKVVKDTVPKRSYDIILPYLGPLSNKVHRRIKNIFQTVLPAGQIKILFKTTSRLSHMFRFKDMVSPDLKSHVIYEFKCSTCTSGYIGETRVHFKTRNCQHLGISPFTEKPLSSCVNTAVTEHIKHNQCKSNLKDFKIIGTEQDYYKRLIKESLFIKLRDYDLNKQHTSTTLYLF